MLDTFISWLIPFLCGGAVTFAGTMLIKLKAIKNGLQCLLRAEIIRSYVSIPSAVIALFMQKRHSQGHIKHITPSAVMT